MFFKSLVILEDFLFVIFSIVEITGGFLIFRKALIITHTLYLIRINLLWKGLWLKAMMMSRKINSFIISKSDCVENRVKAFPTGKNWVWCFFVLFLPDWQSWEKSASPLCIIIKKRMRAQKKRALIFLQYESVCMLLFNSLRHDCASIKVGSIVLPFPCLCWEWQLGFEIWIYQVWYLFRESIT